MATDSVSQDRITRIGSVAILKPRVYPLDAECHCDSGSSVYIEPGEYPLYNDGMTTWWVMYGQLNQGGGGAWRLGDGMFGLRDGDVQSGIEVTFPSQRYGPDEWTKLLAEDIFTDGHPEQRIRVVLAANTTNDIRTSSLPSAAQALAFVNAALEAQQDAIRAATRTRLALELLADNAAIDERHQADAERTVA